MKATFLVDLEIGTETNLPLISEDIQDALISSGFDVLFVRHWSRPSLSPPGLPGSHETLGGAQPPQQQTQ